MNSVHSKELVDLITRLNTLITQQNIPVAIFSTPLSPAEALVKHLKEHHHLRYTQIATVLNRDQRGIWSTYRRACTKYPRTLPTNSAHHVPLSLFHNRTLSILEHITSHLRDQHLPLKTIATLLNKHPSTISTTYRRARRKQ